jgi:hypothetical protein
MSKPIFTIVTTAKNEKNREILKETFENWEQATQSFGKCVEFVVVDAGGNTELPSMDSTRIVPSEEYMRYKKELYRSRIIRHGWWDSPSIGRNLGFQYAKGRIIVFQDIDSLFSTGTDLDHEYVTELDTYENWFKVMYQAFKRKNIVAATSSLRPRDSRKISRRFAAMGLNTMTRISLKLPPINVQDAIMVGASIPGCSIALLREIAVKLTSDGTGPYDPELAIGEDYKLSRTLGMCGKVSYEKKAGIFVRTLSRVSSGFDITKSLFYALKWAPHYLFPGRYCKYKRHTLSM